MGEKCENCGKPSLVRSHTCEDYLVWGCGCGNQELEHFSDMSEESWLWLKEDEQKHAETRQPHFVSQHFNDAHGNPAGGTTFGQGFTIGWQNGPLNRGADRLVPNGAFVEDIIAAAKDRLEYYQASKFACSYNADAIACLKGALDCLHARTADREKRQVEGTHAE